MNQYGTERSCDAAADPSANRGKRMCDGVYSLHEPDGQPEVEMVFIHGLQPGDSKDAYEKAYWTTWLARDGSQNNCWPKTWLADVFPKARILSVSYDASRALRSSTSGTLDLHLFAETLVQEMVFREVDIGQHGCPVVFVCHCLGGLIAKKIIALAHERFQGNKRIEKLLHNTKAFVFYATPHGGSELVKMNPELARLNSAFEAIQRKVYNNKCMFRVVAETHETSSKWFSSSMIVEEPSVRHVGYDHVVHVAADHFDVCKPETERDTNFLYLTGCIEEVVAEYKSKQDKISGLPSLIVGVDAKLVELQGKLMTKPIVGLVGMGGVGKTTLSKVMFNSERERYQKCSYLEDVKSHSNIVDFQKQLLRELCDEIWNENEDSKDYLRKIRQCIETKKVLVVIDDVGTEKNLKALQVLAFQKGSSGSRLVITCRNKAILSDYVSEGDKIEVDVLDNEQSRELFSHYAFHAFSAVHEIGGEERLKFESEAVKIVTACGGLPLSIEVIGQHLRKRNHLPGEERLDMWKEALKRLQEAMTLEGYSNDDEKLWTKLRISYDDLEDLEKGLFLDFACILCDVEEIDMNTLVRLWGSRGGLQTLIDSSLIKVATSQFQDDIFHAEAEMYALFQSQIKELVIHDQLRDMGRWIVRDLAKKDSQKHMMFMWERNEVLKFLEDNEDSSSLEGLSMIEIERLKLHNPLLWQLFLHKICLQESYQQYPNLRMLNLSRSAENVVKDMFTTCSVGCQNIRWLCLDRTAIRENQLELLSANLKRLCVLHIRYCEKVVTLPSSIGNLFSLKELNLKKCLNLRTLPKTIGKLKNLQILILSGCRSLQKLPESMGDLVQLLELDLNWCMPLKRLPSTLGNLKLLKLLNLCYCHQLEVIPEGVGQMVKLESLDLGECYGLQTMCEFDTKMHHLHTLRLNFLTLESFKSLGNCYRLRALDLRGCTKLRIPNLAESVGQLRELRLLDLTECDSMGEEVAETLRKGNLRTEHLEVLCLSEFPASGLPPCPQLKFLRLHGDSGTDLPVAFSESLGNLVELRELLMVFMACVPESVGNLTQLKNLYVNWSTMKLLPDALTKLVGLEILSVRWSSCERLPEHIGDLVSLRGLSLSGCKELVELPPSLGRLSQLRALNLDSCKNLKRLPESLGLLTQLRQLDLAYCENLECLPDCFVGLTQLSVLHLRGCTKLKWKEEVRQALQEHGCRIDYAPPTVNAQ